MGIFLIIFLPFGPVCFGGEFAQPPPIFGKCFSLGNLKDSNGRSFVQPDLKTRHFFNFQLRKNVLDVSYHVSQYQTIISELRGEIGRLKEKIQAESGNFVNGPPNSGIKKAELQELREQMVANFKDQMNLRSVISRENPLETVPTVQRV